MERIQRESYLSILKNFKDKQIIKVILEKQIIQKKDGQIMDTTIRHVLDSGLQ